MGLMDNIKKQIGSQFIEIIEWLDDTTDSLVYRFPVYNQEIKMGAQLIVRENQVALFVNEGKAADLFTPGRYELQTQNVPILTTLRGWKYGFQSPFKAEVYFFNTRLFTDLKWGTTNPVMMRDAEFGMIRLRAFGTYAMRIADARVFFQNIVGTRGLTSTDEITGQLRSTILSRLSDAIAEAKIAALDLAAHYDELSVAGRGVLVARVRRLRSRALALLHREHLAARGGREGDRPALEAGRPGRQDAPVHPDAGGRGDRHRGGESGRSRRCRRRPRRRRRDGADDEPGDGTGGPSGRQAPRRPAAAGRARRERSAAAGGHRALVAHRRRQDLRSLHRRGPARDGRGRPGPLVDPRLESRRRRLGAALDATPASARGAAAPPPPPPAAPKS